MYTLNISQVIVPNSTLRTITADQMAKLAQFNEFKFDIPTESSVLIQNKEQLEKLSETAHKMVEKNNYELKLKDIDYKQIKSNWILSDISPKICIQNYKHLKYLQNT